MGGFGAVGLKVASFEVAERARVAELEVSTLCDAASDGFVQVDDAEVGRWVYGVEQSVYVLHVEVEFLPSKIEDVEDGGFRSSKGRVPVGLRPDTFRRFGVVRDADLDVAGERPFNMFVGSPRVDVAEDVVEINCSSADDVAPFGVGEEGFPCSAEDRPEYLSSVEAPGVESLSGLDEYGVECRPVPLFVHDPWRVLSVDGGLAALGLFAGDPTIFVGRVRSFEIVDERAWRSLADPTEMRRRRDGVSSEICHGLTCVKHGVAWRSRIRSLQVVSARSTSARRSLRLCKRCSAYLSVVPEVGVLSQQSEILFGGIVLLFRRRVLDVDDVLEQREACVVELELLIPELVEDIESDLSKFVGGGDFIRARRGNRRFPFAAVGISDRANPVSVFTDLFFIFDPGGWLSVIGSSGSLRLREIHGMMISHQ